MQNEQVIAEHFYINDEFNVPDNGKVNCFEEFVIPAGKTLDFAANFSSTYGKYESNRNSVIGLDLYQDGEVVAWTFSSEAVPDGLNFTHNAHLIFTEKNDSDEDLPYKLCLYVDQGKNDQ